MKKLESFSPKEFGWSKLSGFVNFLNLINSPRKWVGSFIWTNLNPLHPRMLCAKFGSNWPSDSGRDFQISSCIFTIVSPWKRAWSFIFPSPKDALSQVLLTLAQGFWRRRSFFNFVNVFSLFRNNIPLEKGGALYLNKLESPSPMDALCQVWLKLTQWFWRRNGYNANDDGQWTNFDQKGSLKPSAQVI